MYLYGGHNANVRKSRSELTTRAPVLLFWKRNNTIRVRMLPFLTIWRLCQDKYIGGRFLMHWNLKSNCLSWTEFNVKSQLSDKSSCRVWRMRGHVLWMLPTEMPRVTLQWTPDGQWKRVYPEKTWKRTVKGEIRDRGWTW